MKAIAHTPAIAAMTYTTAVPSQLVRQTNVSPTTVNSPT
jgi:hypothetical protein